MERHILFQQFLEFQNILAVHLTQLLNNLKRILLNCCLSYFQIILEGQCLITDYSYYLLYHNAFFFLFWKPDNFNQILSLNSRPPSKHEKDPFQLLLNAMLTEMQNGKPLLQNKEPPMSPACLGTNTHLKVLSYLSPPLPVNSLKAGTVFYLFWMIWNLAQCWHIMINFKIFKEWVLKTAY